MYRDSIISEKERNRHLYKAVPCAESIETGWYEVYHNTWSAIRLLCHWLQRSISAAGGNDKARRTVAFLRALKSVALVIF